MGNSYSFTKTISKPVVQITKKKALYNIPAKKPYKSSDICKSLPYSKNKHETHNDVKSATK